MGAMRGGPSLTKRSQLLRRNMTEAERALWRELRHDRLGSRFRRQHPIPPYIVDYNTPTVAIGSETPISGGRGGKFYGSGTTTCCRIGLGIVQIIAAALAGGDLPPP